jgi:hypothetical protein
MNRSNQIGHDSSATVEPQEFYEQNGGSWFTQI